MPLSDYLQDNFATRGIRPLAALADYYMANRQQPAMPQQTIAADANMGYPLTPQQEAMYAQASPRRVVQLTPEELAAFNAQRNAVDTSYSGSGADFGPEQPIQAAPVAVQPAPPQQQEAAPIYPEREHELRRQDIRAKIAKANQVAGLMIQQNPQYADAIQSSLKRNIEAFADPELLKSFDEGFAASTIKAELPAVIRNDRMINNIRSELIAAEKIQDKTDKVDRLQTIIPKLLQSAASGGSDAMQMGEFLLGAPEIQNYTRWTTANRMDVGFGSLIKYLNDPSIKDKFDVNPDSYLNKAKGIYNSIAKSRNLIIDGFEMQSSPEWVAKKTGLKRLDLFKSDIESELGSAASTPSVAPAKPESKRIRFEMRGGALMPIQD